MNNDSFLTPLGCGPCREEHPDFPLDLLPRLESLDLGLEDLYLAWELVRLAGGLMDKKQERAMILLVLTVRFFISTGSTRLPLSGGYPERLLDELEVAAAERTAFESLLEKIRRADCREADPGISLLFGRPGDYRPLILDRGSLYIQKLHVLEERVGNNLRQRLNSRQSVDGEVEPALERALQAVLDNPPVGPPGKIVLDIEQQNAIRAALTGKIAVISGRPGSGKTSIVAGLLRVLARIGRPPLASMALAAPTGKAADRMRRAITDHLNAVTAPDKADLRLSENCPPSLTLHRLLGYSPGEDRFWHSEQNPLSEELIIVDEGSMIDLIMADQLLRALKPESRLVLLGDADQLPSIGTGAVLRDLCRAPRACRQKKVVVLKHSYRAREQDSAGSKILEVAAAINAGNSPAAAARKSFKAVCRATDLEFEGVEHLEVLNLNQLEAFCSIWEERFRNRLSDLRERLFREYLSGPRGFDEKTTEELRVILDHYNQYQILCVTRVSAMGAGAEAVNRRFHRRWREELKKSSGAPGNSNFLTGEPVLITRNDYNLQLFNGDSGLLLTIKPGERPYELMAVFPRGGSFVAYPLEVLRGRLELAWATTVHKAQGSEYDHVALLLPAVPVRPLTRELLYTAATRAKKSVTFVGSTGVLEHGIRQKTERLSALADLLQPKQRGIYS